MEPHATHRQTQGRHRELSEILVWQCGDRAQEPFPVLQATAFFQSPVFGSRT